MFNTTGLLPSELYWHGDTVPLETEHFEDDAIPLEYTAYYPPAAQATAPSSLPGVTQTRLQTLGGAAVPSPTTLKPRQTTTRIPVHQSAPMRGIPLATFLRTPPSLTSHSLARGTSPPSNARPVGHLVAGNSSRQQQASLPTTQASPRLSQPWEAGFSAGSEANASPYRLVSDLQPSDTQSSSGHSRTSPPAVTSVSVRQTRGSSAPTATRSPILNLGKDFLNEFKASDHRHWSPSQTIRQTADFSGKNVTVRNIRYFKYQKPVTLPSASPPQTVSKQFYDYTFDLTTIQTLDIIVVPSKNAQGAAHVEASFGFANGVHLGLSIEARFEDGETFDPITANLRQYELIYVFADERDLLHLATDVDQSDAEIYRLRLQPAEVREIFVDALQRANKLAQKPEFYHPLSNCATSNLVSHINKARPGAIPWQYRSMRAGTLAADLFDLGLLETVSQNFGDAQENARVKNLVETFGDLEFFSVCIRQKMF